MSAVAELEASLQALLGSKPPGVTKGRIGSITALCIENIKSESVLVQKIWTHFKRTPATHKLGVLYVVDSVVREWISKAAHENHPAGKGSSAPDGTYAAGVNRITELLPSFMTDLIATAPEDQREKITKLVGIWGRGNTFPKHILTDLEDKMASQKKKSAEAAAANAVANAAPPPAAPPIQQPSAFDFLTSLSQNGTAPTPQQQAQYPGSNGILGQQLPYSMPNPAAPEKAQPQYPGYPPSQPSQAAPTAPPTAPAPAGGALPAHSDDLAALTAVMPPSAMTDTAKFQKYLNVLQQLVTMGVPADQWKSVIDALEQQEQTQAQAQTGASSYVSAAGPTNQYQRRSRSRSPGARENVYGRQRSPARRRSPPSPDVKNVSFDPTLPPDHIKVTSRTLFVGGTQCNERELREVFGRFGNVQSVIPNPNKRHAFVKMFTRAESEAARDGMETSQDPMIKERARSVKWGVGFGPRECCDYATGISVIPIHRLTDADRRWIESAEYGGNGGKPLEGGQVMEEPDIEIGAGVSSKAISLKVGASAQGNSNGNGNSNRGGGGGAGGNGGRGRRYFDRGGGQQQQQPAQGFQSQQQYGGRQGQGSGNPNFERVQTRRRDEDPSMGAAPPAVPNFGYQFPAGFPTFQGGQQPQQQPYGQ